MFEQHSTRLISSHLVFMPPAAGTHTNSPRPSSPANAHDTDGAEDQATVAGVWKRRYLVLQETVNAQNSSKRKEK